jgi:hypothetical protein
MTNYLHLLSKFKNGWSPTSTRSVWFSLDSRVSALHFHREASEEGPQRNVFQKKARSGTYFRRRPAAERVSEEGPHQNVFHCNFGTVASTILQTDKQQTEQSHAFYMIHRLSNSEQNLTVSSLRPTLETELIGAVVVSQGSSAISVTGCDAEN